MKTNPLFQCSTYDIIVLTRRNRIILLRKLRVFRPRNGGGTHEYDNISANARSDLDFFYFYFFFTLFSILIEYTFAAHVRKRGGKIFDGHKQHLP